MKVFTVLDVKAQKHHQPFFEQTTETGIRAFKAACQDPKVSFNQYPEDYTLLEIGQWNENEGLIHPHDKPRIISLASEHVQR